MESPRYLRDLLRRLPPSLGRDELSLHLGHGEGELRERQRALDDQVLARADLDDGQAVLDVGCGIGGTLARIDGRHRRMRLVGLNAGRDQLDLAARHVAPHLGNQLRWVHGDAMALPFSAGTFDRVLCVEAMFHFRSRVRFFQEAARVLQPGGRLVVTDIRVAAEADPQLVAHVTDGLAPWPDPMGREGPLVQLAQAAGFDDVTVEDATDAIGPSLAAIIGPDAIAAPGAVRDRGDRGTAALGALHAQGHLQIVYGAGTRR